MKVTGVYDVTNVGTVDTQGINVGDTFEDVNGDSYVYVQNQSTSAAVAVGTVLYETLASPNVVTTDISTTKRNLVRGIGIAVIAAGYYGWLKTWGRGTVKTNGDDDIASGDAIIGAATNDGVCDSVAAGTAPTNKVIGFAYEADDNSANTVGANIEISRA